MIARFVDFIEGFWETCEGLFEVDKTINILRNSDGVNAALKLILRPETHSRDATKMRMILWFSPSVFRRHKTAGNAFGVTMMAIGQ